MSISSISGARPQAVYQPPPPPVAKPTDADGDHDGSTSKAADSSKSASGRLDISA